jgi:hypothetical protein
LRFIVGVGYSNEVANHFGNLLIESMMKSLHTPVQQIAIGHASFIESCYHHCLFCNHMENAWNGHRVIADETGGVLADIQPKLSPAKAFGLWYSNHSLFQTRRGNSASSGGSSSTFEVATSHRSIGWKMAKKNRMMNKENSTSGSSSLDKRFAYHQVGLFLQNEMYPCYHCCTCSLH